QVDEKGHEVSIVETLLHININNGQTNQQVHKVLEDGVVTPAELADTEEILEEMENHIRQLREALKSEAATYISKVKKEKA
ncbi:XRE family transcriptional regulator, partial [Acinetobacter baumannii]